VTTEVRHTWTNQFGQ